MSEENASEFTRCREPLRCLDRNGNRSHCWWVDQDPQSVHAYKVIESIEWKEWTRKRMATHVGVA